MRAFVLDTLIQDVLKTWDSGALDDAAQTGLLQGTTIQKPGGYDLPAANEANNLQKAAEGLNP